MTKKQYILVSIVAALPAAALLVFLVLGLLKGMLSDSATVSPVLWIVWVLAALGSASVAFLPFGIMFFPGLMPEPSLAAAGVSDRLAAPSRKSEPVTDDEGDEENEFEDDGEESEYSDDEEEGEQLFEDDALGDDFDDEYSDSFDDDTK
jgi:hypothetical protein